MRIDLAWHNLWQKPKRAVAAVAGVGVAVLLMFMQLGLYLTVRRAAVLLHDRLDFDLAVVSVDYIAVKQPGSFRRSRLDQCPAVPGVRAVVPLHVGYTLYRNPHNRLRYEVIVFGLDPADRPFRGRDLNDPLPLLQEDDAALADSLCKPEFGPFATGQVTELNGRRLTAAGRVKLGTGFSTTGNLLVSRRTYLLHFPDADPDHIALGLVRLEPGADLAATQRRLAERLGPDVAVLTREELAARDIAYWVRVKPLGLPFTWGLWLGFAVGAVTLYQVLTAEATQRRTEFGTLLALGWGRATLWLLVVRTGFYYVLLGFGPAWLIALVLHTLIRQTARLPMYLEPTQVLTVLGLALLMAAAAGALAVGRINPDNPAELF